jgi:glycosyltransferase involved in cell wall biosynthesis
LDERFEVIVVGTTREIVERIASHRPGAPTVVLPPFGGKFDARSIVEHVRAFRRLAPDLCHINLRTPYACQGGIVAGVLTHTRMVAVEHLPLHSPSGFMRWSRRRLAPFYAAHVSVGDESARLVEAEVGLRAGSIRTIHNGVPEVDLPPVPEGRSPVVLGSVGRLDEQKGYELLVEALAGLPDASGVVVGDGPLRAALEARAAELGVAGRLQLPGWSDDARSRLPDFDVFVLPSRYEGFPLSIIEAMLAGLPVVATDVGSIREAVVDGETGLLVPSGDAAALTAALRRLVDDPGLRARLGAAGRARARREFTARAMAARYERLYDEVVRGR